MEIKNSFMRWARPLSAAIAIAATAACAAKDARPSSGLEQIESAGPPGRVPGGPSTAASSSATDIGGSMVAQSSTAVSSTTPGDTTHAPKVEIPHVDGR
ncbi:MAG: hypothetical protein H0W63_10530, partial [Gemmatimonadaceae bacterium]|nr:hypothetical protein [Gemmatimonadaceae bacterium]